MLIKKKHLNFERGFTLLETMIAMAIMMVAYSSILIVQSSAMESADKAKRLNVVSMLARGIMSETELQVQNKEFAEAKKEEAGQFKEPFQDFDWKKEIKEIKFPNFSGGSKKAEKDDESGANAATETLTKLVTKFLSDSVREIKITISWKKGSGTQSYTVTNYWVDLKHEFPLSE